MVVTAKAPAPHLASSAAGWDSEVIVLRGDDRVHLRDRANTLASYIERHPATVLADLASTLAGELQPGGARLAVVAASATDLVVKLRRAADRLAEPTARQIRDAGGIYFTDSPLYHQGTLAVLYPGEGAQYADMLLDLCGVFPEVEDTFAWCDRIAEDAGKSETSLRRILHLPADASPADRAATEAELRKLGPSIFGVLIADFAITRILWNLQVPVSAVAGHSAGELGALLAAGAMRSEEVLGPKLAEIMEMMQRQEDEAGGPDVALLAVGAGKATVDEVADAISRGAVIVAMDNCPHQCVAVGPTPFVAAVEAALTERGVICERLPFRRPYHTPLFEPWMGPFRELFADVPFESPHTPVYSCSTGAKFPNDPAAIRELTVNHWVTPVEFTRLVQSMYDDGVRLFVEAGPRGNLSAFAEDILRGKPFAAIPANLPRKSGPTQINHLVAQLVAHHVPLNLGHLYSGRDVRRVEWECDSSSIAVRELSPDVMDTYLATMEQFLDVQREVMEAYLASGALASGGRQPPVPEQQWADAPRSLDNSGLTPPARQEDAIAYALVGRVEQHEPGRSIVFRRVMDEREDRYADDHTLGGRGVSRVNPAQNGLPVLPMTFSLEAMAEAAAQLVPGKVVTAIRNIRLYRWLPFDPEPTTLEVRATVASVDPQTGVVEVKADVRDLGNSFLRDGANKPASEAVVVLADRYPDPPAAHPFHLTDELPCRSTVEDLRRNMFHGPLFQMIRTLDRCGKEGIEGTLEVQPRDRWFRSTTEPHVVLDPVLIDAAMHILGAWHLEQPDWSGRILLPIGVDRVEFYAPTPDAGQMLLVRGHNEQETARQVRHGLEVFAPDGRIWLRLVGAGYWRFYLPFGDVNFFGPKDQYFLSHRCPEAEAGPSSRCYFLDPPLDLRQPVLRASGIRVTMSEREIADFQSWKGSEQELDDWFFGRLLAKDAVRAVWNERHGGGVFPADMETELNGAGRLMVRPRGDVGPEPYPPVSVAIAGGKVAAFSAFAPHVGIAIQLVPKKCDTGAVRTIQQRAACLAVADALRCTSDKLSADTVDPHRGTVTVTIAPHQSAHYVNVTGRVRVQTARHKDVVIATTTCEAERG